MEKCRPSEDLHFQSYADGVEREPLDEKIRIVISLPRELSGYVEESKVGWAKLQLLIERQKYLIQEIEECQSQLLKVTKLLEEEWEKVNNFPPCEKTA
jgi:hypothetical protein